MAQPNLGNRVQIRYLAPKVIVDTLSAQAGHAPKLPFSQVVSALLTELTGCSQLKFPKALLPVEMPYPATFEPDPNPSSKAWLKCRVPIEVNKRLIDMAREEGIPAGPGNQARNKMITRLLARRLGYTIDAGNDGSASTQQQLLLAAHHDTKDAYAEAS